MLNALKLLKGLHKDALKKIGSLLSTKNRFTMDG